MVVLVVLVSQYHSFIVFRLVSAYILGSSGMSSRNLSSPNLNYSVSTLSMSVRYFGNELNNHGPNTVIPFS